MRIYRWTIPSTSGITLKEAFTKCNEFACLILYVPGIRQ
jgi:hypothetical protein